MFEDYKNIHLGKTAILFGTGTTLRNVMDVKLNPSFIKIGVNSFVYNEKIRLDYLFAGDPNGDKGYNKNRAVYNNYSVNIEKFYRNPFENICGFDNDNNGVNYDIISKDIFYNDISKGMGVHTSIIFEALQFILYTGVSKIYLVGITCIGNRSTEKWLSQLNPDNINDSRSHIACWKKAEEWMSKEYPLVEVIDIETQGLKEIFKGGEINDILG